MNRGYTALWAMAAAAAVTAGTACTAEEPAPEAADVAEGTTHVEIVYLDHPPVVEALEPVEEVLDGYGDALTVERVDADSTRGLELAEANGLTGHVALAVLIDGKLEFDSEDGAVRFEGFPDGTSPMPGTEGEWTAEDLDEVLREQVSDE